MIPCMSQATTLSTPFGPDLSSIARAGFRAVELWLTKLETYLQDHTIAEAKSVLEGEGLRPVAAASQGGLLLSVGAEREAHWDHFRRRLGWLGELGVPTLVVATDFAHAPTLDDYRRGAARIAEAAEVASAFGVRLAIEFQKGSGYCTCLETAIGLLAESGAPGVGLCLDLFHYYTGPSKFEDLAYLSAEDLAMVQLSDLSGTPREVAGDADRVLPGDGDFQIGPILDRLDAIGYGGPVSLEVLNPALWSIPADRVADVGHQAMARVLGGRMPSEPRGAP